VHILTTFFVKTAYERSINVIFSLKAFTRRVEQAIKFGPKLLKKSKKNCKFLKFLAIFSIFEAEVRLGSLKILKSRKTKVVSNKYMHLLRLYAQLIFKYFNFAPP
jgi:hypothetical protein